MLTLIPGVQSYEWGVPGGAKDSMVADFAECTPELGFQRESSKPYAELWMGTHPTVPSRVMKEDGTSTLLNDVLQEDQALIGSEVARHFGVDKTCGALPFLFKVLSINKALSIQAHPDKALAERLHGTKPHMYKDDNHKPEMAIAIQPFEGFCGFRPVSEVQAFVARVSELRKVLGADNDMDQSLQEAAKLQKQGANDASQEAKVKDTLKMVFGKLMRASPDVYEPAVSALAERYSHDTNEVSEEVRELVVRLNKQYPKDIGVLCTFFLNLVHLQRGEAMFLGANEPHAYISGHILECMAASDNVVRAGLTPKARDVDVLIDMLTYESASASAQRLDAPIWDGDASGSTLLYNPPIPEFSVLVSSLDIGASCKHRALHGPSIVLITEGQGSFTVDGKAIPVSKGRVFFVPAEQELDVSAESRLVVARAFVEVESNK